MRRTISFSLDPESIARAVREIEGYRIELQRKMNLLTERLVEHGVEVSKMFVRQMDADFTGYLESSIEGYFSPHLHAGWVMAGTPYAIYVEYGTGVVGEGTTDFAAEVGYMYDVNNHGIEGWNYYDPLTDQYWHTAGMVARPFMNMTGKVLDEAAARIASEVFGR